MDPFDENPQGDGAIYAEQNLVVIQAQVDQDSIVSMRRGNEERGGYKPNRYIFGPSLTDADTDLAKGEFVFTVSTPGKSGHGKESPYALVRSSLNGIKVDRDDLTTDAEQRYQFQVGWVRDHVTVIGFSNSDRKVGGSGGNLSVPNFSAQVTGTAMIRIVEQMHLMDPIEILPPKPQMMQFARRRGIPLSKRGLYARPWRRPKVVLGPGNKLWMEQLIRMSTHQETSFSNVLTADGKNIDDTKLAEAMKRAPFPVDQLDDRPTEQKVFLLILGAIERIFKNRMMTFKKYHEALGGRAVTVWDNDMEGKLGELFNPGGGGGGGGISPGDAFTVPVSGPIFEQIYSNPTVLKDIELIMSSCFALFQSSTRNVKGVALDSKTPREALRVYLQP